MATSSVSKGLLQPIDSLVKRHNVFSAKLHLEMLKQKGKRPEGQNRRSVKAEGATGTEGQDERLSDFRISFIADSQLFLTI